MIEVSELLIQSRTADVGWSLGMEDSSPILHGALRCGGWKNRDGWDVEIEGLGRFRYCDSDKVQRKNRSGRENRQLL